MVGLLGRSVTTRAAALLSGTAMLAALAALPATPVWASPAKTQSTAASAEWAREAGPAEAGGWRPMRVQPEHSGRLPGRAPARRRRSREPTCC